MLERNLNGLLVMNSQFLDRLIPLFEVPLDLDHFSCIVIYLHDSQQFEHVLGRTAVDIFQLDIHHRIFVRIKKILIETAISENL